MVPSITGNLILDIFSYCENEPCLRRAETSQVLQRNNHRSLLRDTESWVVVVVRAKSFDRVSNTKMHQKAGSAGQSPFDNNRGSDSGSGVPQAPARPSSDTSKKTDAKDGPHCGKIPTHTSSIVNVHVMKPTYSSILRHRQQKKTPSPSDIGQVQRPLHKSSAALISLP